VPIDDRLLEHLRMVCAEVTTLTDARVEAGRDWWPLAIRWAQQGLVPSRPAAVARPTDTAQVSALVAACSRANVPVTVMGGRSGVSGGSIPAFGGLALDLTNMAGVDAVDPSSLLADVRAGTFGPDLEVALRAHGCTLGHWPQSMALSTLGGWLACRSAGQYSTRYGKIEDMVVGLEVVLADGRVIHTGGTGPRAAVGPDLTQLFVGSEGTLGIITRARLRLHPVAPAEGRRAYGFPDFEQGLEVCRRILHRGATPAVLRLYDKAESARSFDIGDQCILIVLDEADPGLLDATLRVVDEECASAHATSLSEDLVGRWVAHRNDVSALVPLYQADIVVDTIEVAARWSALPHIYQTALAALDAVPGTLAASAHQSHSYTDGACLYFTFAGKMPETLGGDPGTRSEEETRALCNTWAESYYSSTWSTVMAAVRNAGGAISHHHGIGLNRGRFLAPALGEAFGVLSAIKDTLDPRGILNPGKLGFPSPYGEVRWP
jgi:alkyldihydroxyacetonephosphate synthase